MKSRSLAAAIISSPSAVSKTSYGAISGNAVPWRPGALPVRSVAVELIADQRQRGVEERDVDVAAAAGGRALDAARRRCPSAAQTPVPMSITEAPTRTPDGRPHR